MYSQMQVVLVDADEDGVNGCAVTGVSVQLLFDVLMIES